MTPKKLLIRCYVIGMSISIIIGFWIGLKYSSNPLVILGLKNPSESDFSNIGNPSQVPWEASSVFWQVIGAGILFSGIAFVITLFMKLKSIERIKNFFNNKL
ncbi:hypothetical protein GMD78_05605 [Ornithinibacillus sp. L9]|uniref:Uncharacterized protein n=1 Tax=Ornithinibacillus caprae TaxID=2678566 RepID=A0A6N8FHZ3_9BACI|nr:hypothetical protein [Ornithinibacillus caprae]MUK87874.1 hypothetical protein [Ornithinibacillus caprae]